MLGLALAVLSSTPAAAGPERLELGFEVAAGATDLLGDATGLGTDVEFAWSAGATAQLELSPLFSTRLSVGYARKSHTQGLFLVQRGDDPGDGLGVFTFTYGFDFLEAYWLGMVQLPLSNGFSAYAFAGPGLGIWLNTRHKTLSIPADDEFEAQPFMALVSGGLGLQWQKSSTTVSVDLAYRSSLTTVSREYPTPDDEDREDFAHQALLLNLGVRFSPWLQ